MPDPERERPANGSQNAAISNMVVHLMNEYTGRGPTRARTYIKDDLISVVLRDTLTHGERSLIADGQSALVLRMRHAFQLTMSAELQAGIESITGGKVLAFLSSNNTDPDVAIESFLMAPAEETPADG